MLAEDIAPPTSGPGSNATAPVPVGHMPWTNASDIDAAYRGDL
ncbi:hypothetical protein SAMN02745830_01300 [Streptomyces sp. Amel2xC10]|nr:hypothetical protein SAMN02745830_01300 [Streptomyces sp. Amel2xC10]